MGSSRKLVVISRQLLAEEGSPCAEMVSGIGERRQWANDLLGLVEKKQSKGPASVVDVVGWVCLERIPRLRGRRRGESASRYQCILRKRL